MRSLSTDKWLALLKDSGFRRNGGRRRGVFSGRSPRADRAPCKSRRVRPSRQLRRSAHQQRSHRHAVESKPSYSRPWVDGWFSPIPEDWLSRSRNGWSKRGGECVLVQAGDRFDASNPRRPIINLDEPEDYRRLLKDGTSWRGVLHAWTLDAVFDEANALPDLNHAEHLGCRSTLFLVQALAEMASSQPPKIWLLTRGAQPAWPQIKAEFIRSGAGMGFGPDNRARTSGNVGRA